MARHILRELIADPGPMGLFAFATVTLVAGVVKTGWVTDVVIGVNQIAFWYGGLAQVIAGVIDLLRGAQVTGATFTAFGLHWMLQGMTMVTSPGWIGVYPNPEEYNRLQGFYFLSFTIIAIGATVGVSRKSYCHIALLVLVDLVFGTDAIYCWAPSSGLRKTTGYLCVITAALAFYIAIADQWKEELGIKLPLLPRSPPPKTTDHVADYADAEKSIV